MKRIFSCPRCLLACVTFCLSVAQLVGQNNISFDFVEGDFFLCAEDSVVTIKIKPNPDLEFENVQLVWDRNSGERTVITDPSKLVQTHRYRVGHLFRQCELPSTCLDVGLCYNIQLRAQYKDRSEPENISRDIIFRKPPDPEIEGHESIYCSGQTAFLTSGTCPSNDPSMRYEWTLPDGTAVEGGTVQYTFGPLGEFTFKLKATNDCGSVTTNQKVRVVDVPVAVAVADSNVVAGYENPYRVCFDGATAIRLNGKGTQSTTHTSWAVTPASGVSIAKPGKLVTTAQFTAPGSYTFTLLADNRNCGITDEESFTVEVVESAPLRLDPQADACPYLDYTPGPFVDSNADYFLDGARVTSFPVRLEGRSSPYIIRAEKTTLCGDQVERDTIFVDIPQEARLLSPPNNTDFCPENDRVELLVSVPGGTWEPADGLILEGGAAYFDLGAGGGAYRFTYASGQGDCRRELNVSLSIHEQVLDLPATNVVVCSGSAPVPIDLRPTTGVLQGPGVREGTLQFDPADKAAGQYALTYTYDNPGTGCTEVGNLIVEVVAEPDGVVGPPIELCNTNQVIQLRDYLPGMSYSPPDALLTFTGRGVTNASGGYNPGLLSVGDTDTVLVRFSEPRVPGGCWDEEVLLVSITDVAVAAAGRDTTLCSGGSPFQLGTSGGNWSGPSVGPDGLVDVSSLSPGTYTYTLTVGNGLCQSTDTRQLTLTPGDGVRLATDQLYLCDTARWVTLPSTFPEQGGAWTGPLTISGAVIDVADVAPGTYSFAYRVATLPEGCNAAEYALHILPRPTVEMEGDSRGCVDGDCLVLKVKAGTADRYRWQGAGGLSVTGDSLCYPSGTAGNHGVNLVGYRTHPLTDEVLCSSEVAERDLKIFDVPRAARIQASTRSVCPGEGVTFSAVPSGQASDQPVEYRWEIGTAVYTGPAVAELQFPAPQEDTIYQISLTTEGYCSVAGDTVLLEVKAEPRAEIGVQFDQPCSGGELVLANRSRGGVEEVLWTSTDGDRFTTFDPPLLYPLTDDLPRPITYTLAVGNRCGTDTITKTVTVNPTNVKARIAYRDTVVCVGETFEATNISTPGARVEYRFADGNHFTGDTLRRRFTEAGLYRFTVYAFGCGYDSSEWQVRALDLPVATLDAPGLVCPDQPFDYRLTGSGQSYDLDFGDGTASSVNVGSHRYTFADTSVLVRYRVTDREGCTAVGQQTVTLASRPAVSILAEDSLCVGQAVNFRGGGGATCRWDFGDGHTGDGCATSHVFSAAGSFSVDLIGTSDLGCTDTATTVVFVRPTPVATLAADYAPDNCGPTPVQFSYGSEAEATSSYKLWPGDGSDWLEGRDPVYTYATGGDFTAQLLVGYDGVCFDTATVAVDIAAFPLAGLTVEDERCFPEEFAVLEVQTSNPADNIALFGENIFLNGRNRFELSAPGAYEIEVISSDGCDTVIQYQLDPVVPLTIQTIGDTIIEYGDSLRLYTQTNTSGLRFSWTWPEYLSTDTLAEPWAWPLDDTEFVVAAYDSHCLVRDSVRVGVVRPAELVYVPSAFSPNGDGNNERLAAFPRVGVDRILQFDVYDRWGVRVHRQEQEFGLPGSPLNWDGRHRGVPLNSAVFVYQLTYLDRGGEIREQSGEVLLLR